MFVEKIVIAGQLSQGKDSTGIQVLEADTFKLQSFQTVTGVDKLLKRMYKLFADYVLKNPFYSLDMPIRCELFDRHLKEAIDSAHRTYD